MTPSPTLAASRSVRAPPRYLLNGGGGGVYLCCIVRVGKSHQVNDVLHVVLWFGHQQSLQNVLKYFVNSMFFLCVCDHQPSDRELQRRRVWYSGTS